MHVQRLRDLIRAHLDDPVEFASVWDAVTEAELTPWYRENLEEDRAQPAGLVWPAISGGKTASFDAAPGRCCRAAAIVSHVADPARSRRLHRRRSATSRQAARGLA